MIDCNDSKPFDWIHGHYTIPIPRDPKGFTAYYYQDSTWKKMSEYFSSSKEGDIKKGGIIWIPTGGGKTVIAAKWLLENAIDNGYKVIWFAHRGILLEQAAGTFRNLLCHTPLMKNKKEVRLAYVISTGQGGTQWKNVKPNVDVVFASLASSTNHFDDIESFGKSTEKGVYIVFDEVQHAYATTYKRLIENIQENITSRLIGLSATPYRMTKEESIGLWTLFSAHDKAKYTISPIIRLLQRDLIEKEILAQPKFVNKSTDIEPIVKEGDRILDNFNDLTSAAYKSLAENEVRNQLICECYIENYMNSAKKEALFGKTIIFTPDISGNKKLYDTFQKILRQNNLKNEIKVNYIDSSLTETKKKEIINQYRSTGPNSIDILLNVEMCTEGFDAPLTKTVFLARPSNSETLVRQMMGRAMRGPKAGGNKICYIVQFVDVLPENFSVLDPEKIYEAEAGPGIDFHTVPKDVLNQYKRQFDIFNSALHCSLALQYCYIPAGWFYFQQINPGIENCSLTDETPERTDIKEHYIMYLAHQIQGYDRLARCLGTEEREKISYLDYNALIGEFFYDCPDPVPPESSVMNFIELFPLNGNSYEHDIKIKYEDSSLVPRVFFDSLIKSSELTSENIESLNIADFEKNAFLSTFYRSNDELITDIKKYLYQKEHSSNFTSDNTNFSIIRRFIEEYNEQKITFDYQVIIDNCPSLSKFKVKKSLEIREKEFFNVGSPIGFCRYTNSGVILYISTIVKLQAVPQAIIEFILYHLYLHSVFPFDHHGHLMRENEKLFNPSEYAINQIRLLPFWELLSEKPTLTQWSSFCRSYLGLFLNYKISEILTAGKENEKHINGTDEVNVDLYL